MALEMTATFGATLWLQGPVHARLARPCGTPPERDPRARGPSGIRGTHRETPARVHPADRTTAAMACGFCFLMRTCAGRPALLLSEGFSHVPVPHTSPVRAGPHGVARIGPVLLTPTIRGGQRSLEVVGVRSHPSPISRISSTEITNGVGGPVAEGVAGCTTRRIQGDSLTLVRARRKNEHGEGEHHIHQAP